MNKKQILLDLVSMAIDSIVIEDWVKTEDIISSIEDSAPPQIKVSIVAELKNARDSDMYMSTLYYELRPELEKLIESYYGY